MIKVKVSTWPSLRKIAIVNMKSLQWAKAFKHVRKNYPEHADDALHAKIVK